MTSKERILAAYNGQPVDHPPLTTWCFGLEAPPELRWTRDGVTRRFWYSLRMEHLHTLPQPWDLQDDFNRVLAWKKMGVDDVLDVSVPWSMNPAVSWKEQVLPAGNEHPTHPVRERIYATPSGSLRHAVALTEEDVPDGWVVQPSQLPLIEDYNIPRAVEHAVSSPADVATLAHLYTPPDATARLWFENRMREVRAFAEPEQVPVQAWAGFGMDAVVWFAGTEGAIMLAMDDPEAFAEMIALITRTDVARAQLAAQTDGVDIVMARGWYSSTDFWSPRLFDRYVFPYVKAMADTVHAAGKPFGYVMTTGVEQLGPHLADAGVDALSFVDPVQDHIQLDRARQLLGDRITMVGGINSTALNSADPVAIAADVKKAMTELRSTNRFILHPVDALFPDTPWAGVKAMISAWREGC